ncbi:hypothetical protein HN681_01320 [archaeon]|jgi:hypothetical protein|nr:hypothetical protein [archaeon]MBT3730696.1 hypothetical protein [archaeon]MBT4669598.1 hypothetical protein [archaeon]MBT5030355.1 hypothetical protein [archaeon]MBT5288352.1 hypothetical protein [archaeon]
MTNHREELKNNYQGALVSLEKSQKEAKKSKIKKYFAGTAFLGSLLFTSYEIYNSINPFLEIKDNPAFLEYCENNEKIEDLESKVMNSIEMKIPIHKIDGDYDMLLLEVNNSLVHYQKLNNELKHLEDRKETILQDPKLIEQTEKFEAVDNYLLSSILGSFSMIIFSLSFSGYRRKEKITKGKIKDLNTYLKENRIYQGL